MANFALSKLVRHLAIVAALTAPTLGMSIASAADGVSPLGITFSAEQAYPESFVWSAKQNTFFVGSVHTGVIGKVSLQGVYTAFINDDKLVSTVGISFDAKRNLVWAAIGDLGTSIHSSPATTNKLAAIAAFDADTGERRAYYDLSNLVEGAHFANDLAIDNAGNVYVTDSFSPVVYRVDTKGQASVFAKSDQFKGQGFGLNGIVAHPDGYLLVGKWDTGEIMRINQKNGQDIQLVKLAQPIKGADGFLLRDKQHLLVAQNSGNDDVVELVSNDQWETAKVVSVRKTANTFPSAVTQVGNAIYVLNSRLDTLLTKDAPKVSEYLLQKF